jgi:hypothetical protein
MRRDHLGDTDVDGRIKWILKKQYVRIGSVVGCCEYVMSWYTTATDNPSSFC